MKKFLSILFVLVLALSLVACGKDDPEPTPTPTPSGEVDDGDDPTPTPTPSEALIPTELVAIADSATKVYLTCAGQADETIVKQLVKSAYKQVYGTNANVAKSETADIYEDTLLDANDVIDGSVVFLAVGGSNKGISGAGSTSAKEVQRAQILAQKAEQGKITLVVFHVGGETRRGELSDQFIQAAAPSANLLFVVSSGNADGYFTGVKNLGVPTVFVDAAADLTEYVKLLYAAE